MIKAYIGGSSGLLLLGSRVQGSLKRIDDDAELFRKYL